MSTAIAIDRECNIYDLVPNTGASAYAQRLRDYINNSQKDITSIPASWHTRDSVLSEIDSVFLECSDHGWDGYDAVGITEGTIDVAKRFLRSLPSAIPNPEIVPESSGEIGFEWDFGDNHIFVVSIKGNMQLTFAGILGYRRSNGVEFFDGSIPSVITKAIRGISKAAGFNRS